MLRCGVQLSQKVSRADACTSACPNQAITIEREGGRGEDLAGSWLRARNSAERKLLNDRHSGVVPGYEGKGWGADGRQGTRYEVSGVTAERVKWQTARIMAVVRRLFCKSNC